MPEVIPDDIRASLGRAQVSANLRDYLRAILRSSPAHGVRFHVVVEQLVRVEIRAVPRQLKKTDGILVAFDPARNLFRSMHRVAVDDQVDLARALPNQTPEKLQEHLRSESLAENQERQPASSRDRRDHVAAEPLAGSGHRRSLPATAVARAGLMVRSQAHLVSPVDLGLLEPGLAPDRGIRLVEPPLHGDRVAFVGPPHRLLRRETPSLEQPANRSHRESQATPLLDQLPHRLTSPEREWKFQLVGTAIGHQTHDRGGLVPLQPRLGLAAPFLEPQRRLATLAVRLQPTVQRRATDAEGSGRLRDLKPLFDNSPHNAMAKILERGGRQLSGISGAHGQYTLQPANMSDIECSGK